MTTKPVSLIKFGRMRILYFNKKSRVLHSFGSIHSTGKRIVFTPNWGGRQRFAKLVFEGLGVNGAIVSMVSGNLGMLGEVVSCESTGRTVIFARGESPFIYLGPVCVPTAARYRAVQLSAFKWFESQGRGNYNVAIHCALAYNPGRTAT